MTGARETPQNTEIGLFAQGLTNCLKSPVTQLTFAIMAADAAR